MYFLTNVKVQDVNHNSIFPTNCLKHFVIIMVSRGFKRISQTIISYSNRGQCTFKRHAVIALFLSLQDRQQGEGYSRVF